MTIAIDVLNVLPNGFTDVLHILIRSRQYEAVQPDHNRSDVLIEVPVEQWSMLTPERAMRPGLEAEASPFGVNSNLAFTYRMMSAQNLCIY